MEEEIKLFSKRIDKREKEVEFELKSLKSKISTFSNWAWTFVGIGIVVAISSTIYFFTNISPNSNIKNLDDFMSGTVAAIWSLSGLFFIYVAFLGQKQQLLHQQTEIMYSQLEVKYTRQELEGQKKEMIEQNLTLRQQKFENTYFQLLNLFSSIVNSIDLRSTSTKEITTSGRDCFEVFYKRLNTIVGRKNSEPSIENIIKSYDELYDSIKSDMSHYFRTYYHIIKFIDNSEMKIRSSIFQLLERNYQATNKYFYFITVYITMEVTNLNL